MNRIAFVNLDGQLEIIAPDGSGRQRLTDDTAAYQFPTWSPDGNQLAAAGSQQKEGFIVLCDLTDGEGKLRHLFKSDSRHPFYLYWAPNGRQLTFLATQSAGGLGLYLVPARGGASQMLHAGQPLFWKWHPSLDEIVVHTGGGQQNSRLLFLQLQAEQGIRNPRTIPDPGFFQAPGISASGRYLAYASFDEEGASNLAIHSHSGKRLFALPHHGAVAFTWGPAADLLAFISPEEPAHHFFGPLKLIDPATGRVRILTDETVLAFFWSPNGRWIASLTAVHAGPVGRSEIVPEGYARGYPLPDEISFTLWLNLSLIDVTTGERRLVTPLKPTSLFANHLLPFFDQYALSHQFWSPQSDALVMPTLVSGSEMVVVVPTNGLPPLPLAQGVMGVWSPT